MDTDKLIAGPELDALVAEKVMGWKKIVHPFNNCAFHCCVCDMSKLIMKKKDGIEIRLDGFPAWNDGSCCRESHCEAFQAPSKEIKHAVCQGIIFAPSTDIAAAWEVVERMKRFPRERQSQQWADFCDELGPYDNVAETLWDLSPLEICRAALKAVGA